MRSRLTARQRRLVTENLGLVSCVLEGMKKSGRVTPAEEEDLYAAGCLALCGAAQRWKGKSDGLFPVSVGRAVRREINRALRQGAARAACENICTGACGGEDENLRWAEEKLLGQEFVDYIGSLGGEDAEVLRRLAAGLPVREAAARLGRSDSYVYAARRRLHRLFCAWLAGYPADGRG